MKGLYLQGGGAKGAFQAGVIYGLYERGIEFDVIAGISIGAINSYFILKDSLEEMKNLWQNMNILDNTYSKNSLIIENYQLMNFLKSLKGNNENVKSLYVNYTKIKSLKLEEIIKDITNLSNREQIETIRYSSLLPYRIKEEDDINNIIDNFSFEDLSNKFKEGLMQGIYEGYKLDGGLLNRDLVYPFIDNRVKKLVMVVFSKDYKVPEILLKKYNKEDIILIKPETDFKSNDTLRFSNKFTTNIFKEGYNISKDISI